MPFVALMGLSLMLKHIVYVGFGNPGVHPAFPQYLAEC